MTGTNSFGEYEIIYDNYNWINNNNEGMLS